MLRDERGSCEGLGSCLSVSGAILSVLEDTNILGACSIPGTVPHIYNLLILTTILWGRCRCSLYEEDSKGLESFYLPKRQHVTRHTRDEEEKHSYFLKQPAKHCASSALHVRSSLILNNRPTWALLLLPFDKWRNWLSGLLSWWMIEEGYIQVF